MKRELKLLAIDTSSARCSAALSIGGELRLRSEATARDHARLLLPMVDALLAEGGLGLAQLDGLAFGRGPGSFTGVRVACAVAQGLAFGAGLGVRPVSSLRALAAQPLRNATAPHQIVACLDARMGEVYWACFEVEEGLPTEGAVEQVAPPEVVRLPPPRGRRAGAGVGFRAYPQLCEQLGIAGSDCQAEMEPDAREVALLALRDLGRGAALLPPEAAQPVYLRDQVASVKEIRPL